MSAANPTADDPAIIAAFWQEVALQGWHGLSMRAVAAGAGIAPAALRRRFAAPEGILEAHGRLVDVKLLEDTVEDPHSTPRDRLFDLLMRRLDELQPHRAGVSRLLRDLPTAPFLLAFLAARVPVSLAWMLEAAGIGAAGPRGAARIQGLGLVWLAALRAWEGDESADLSATMAALDRALDQADRAARWLGLDEGEEVREPRAP